MVLVWPHSRELDLFFNCMNNIDTKGVALRLRSTRDFDSKFEKCSAEYQKYLIARDYNPAKSKNNFLTSNIFWEEARRPKIKSNFSTMCNLITQCNPMLLNIETIFKRYLPVLHSNQEMLGIFPENTINVTYKRNQNLKELISPSLFPKMKENDCSIEKFSRRCDICKHFLVVFTEFTGHATKRQYKIRGTLTSNTKNNLFDKL